VFVNDRKIAIEGGLVKIGRLEEEWYEDIDNPLSFATSLKSTKARPDIFSFWQRLPEIQPKYDFIMEWDNVAALKIKTFDYWWQKQIDAKTRNLVRKAEKKGVTVRLASFDDEFIRGVVAIFNETATRQGKPFWHYGKNFDAIKLEFSINAFREDMIGAYFNNELIGFIMLANAGKYAITTQIISKVRHRDKAPNNALIAKAVETCEKKGIPYLVYAKWPRGTLADFKRNNGFTKINLPRYYIPLSIKGALALKLRIHHGFAGILPERFVLRLIDLRMKWYSRKPMNIGKD
jgi:hypothetical protein